MRHVAELTAQGQQVAARAERSSRRMGLLIALAIGLLLLLVLVRVFRDRARYDQQTREATSAYAAPAASGGPSPRAARQ